MLSYQHAYHAGNPADLHKHMALCGIIDILKSQSRRITYMETHAGRGRYDITSKEALKTREAEMGISALLAASGPPLPTPYAKTLAAVKKMYGRNAYPGSPTFASFLLRPEDQIVLMELHPAEHAALERNMHGTNTTVHKADGFEMVWELSPPKPRRGLVLIDPSYEVKSDYFDTAEFSLALAEKWPEACILIWYPMLPANRHKELIEPFEDTPHLHQQVAVPIKDNRGMFGSGLIVLNPPKGARDLLDTVLNAGNPVLAPFAADTA
ncbi:MAG: 23S rRNA (adenine(2030)-N(6))-methyltransferase RlmJ [Alphaproteobacteria bacterium]